VKLHVSLLYVAGVRVRRAQRDAADGGPPSGRFTPVIVETVACAAGRRYVTL